MPTVRVRMYATVREAAGKAELDVDAADVEELLRRLADALGMSFSKFISDLDDRVVILLNGRNVRLGQGTRVRLQENDEVSIFPPVSGG
jgi:MoaD family protein